MTGPLRVPGGQAERNRCHGAACGTTTFSQRLAIRARCCGRRRRSYVADVVGDARQSWPMLLVEPLGANCGVTETLNLHRGPPMAGLLVTGPRCHDATQCSPVLPAHCTANMRHLAMSIMKAEHLPTWPCSPQRPAEFQTRPRPSQPSPPSPPRLTAPICSII
ncbi:hypothetical protein IQ07DRAFT_304595 [Pyrenochaeta sp. DS3sAY3a]|nr:hypothetical protein IQ07DRAFT_304595 [Pyrenochaeta sp. DS3sAY3a]